jgi:hypothetical protein
MRTDHLLDFCVSQPVGASEQPLFDIQDRHALEVESQTNETPFTCCRDQAAQRELAKTEDFFNDANDGLNGAFSQAIDCVSDLGLEFVGHLDDGAGLV